MKLREMATARYWGAKTVEVAVASAVALVLMLYLQARDQAAMNNVRPEDWFVVNSIYVPDHETGSNPLMIYDRTIFVEHRGFWTVEAQRQVEPGQALFFNECSGSGVSQYDLTDTIPNSAVSWTWFFGRDCVLEPGIYRIAMSKDMVVPGFHVQRMPTVYSNVFRVYARGELPG